MTNRDFTFRIWDENTSRFYFLYLHEIVGLERTIQIPKNAIIQQYTGIKDSRDQDVFEGDIIKYYHLHFDRNIEIIAQIQYNNDSGGFIAKWKYDARAQNDENFTCDVGCECVIIGNIFENPELLEKQ